MDKGLTKVLGVIINKIKTSDLKYTILEKEEIEVNNELLSKFLDLAIMNDKIVMDLHINGIFHVKLSDEYREKNKEFLKEIDDKLSNKPEFMLKVKNYKNALTEIEKAYDNEDYSNLENLYSDIDTLEKEIVGLWAQYYLNLAKRHGLLNGKINLEDIETIELYLKKYIANHD